SKRFALIGVIVFILIVELLNTAIEKLSDRITADNDPTIKRVKDMGSAAVGLSLLAAGAPWLWVLVARFWAHRHVRLRGEVMQCQDPARTIARQVRTAGSTRTE